MKKLTVAMLLGLMLCSAQAYAGPAPANEVNKANIFLTDFEKEVARAQGADIGRYHNRREALTRIRELARLYPDDPKVQDLMRRASIANMKSKGDFLEISLRKGNAMFAMIDMFRWMGAGCLTLCLAVPAFAQNQQFQDKANKAPVNGRVYAQQQAEKMQNAFKALQSCAETRCYTVWIKLKRQRA